MDQRPLFSLPDPDAPVARSATHPDQARLRRPDRQQLQWAPRDLDAALAQDHPARAIWDMLERLDLSAFYASVHSVIDGPGRPATDPQVLLALWVLATSEGVGSARALARLCDEHDAYRWLCGGVPVNYHMLADFRVAQRTALDDLLTRLVGSLMAAGAVTLEQVAQDGMRVRASAGASSFRRRSTLRACLKAARAQVRRLAREQDDGGRSERERAAQERAARERVVRVQRALAYLPELEDTKDAQRRLYATGQRARVTEPRSSTTDPDARVMKMADGGFRPAYNVQFATDGAQGVIVGVAVTNAGTDAAEAPPVVEQIVRRTGVRPRDYLVDGGFATRDTITTLAEAGVTVYAPVRAPRTRPEGDRYRPRYGDSAEVAAWRQRMETAAAAAMCRRRGAIAEWANAQVWQHGLRRFSVRGLLNVTSLALLAAISHNILRWSSLSR